MTQQGGVGGRSPQQRDPEQSKTYERELSVSRLVESVVGQPGATADAGSGRSVLLGASGTVVLNASAMVLNFALALVLARTLGSAGYGAYAFALAWATVLAVPASLGLTPLVVRYVASYSEGGNWGLLRGLIRRTNQVVGATSALVVVAAGTVGWLLLRNSSSELVGPYLIGLLLVPLLALTGLRQAALQGLHRVVLGRVPDTLVLSGVFLLLVAGAAERLDERFTATWAAGLNVLAAAVAFVLGAALLRTILPSSVRADVAQYHLREWVRGGIPLLVLALLSALSGQVGTILLGIIDGAESAGTFSVANRIVTFTGFLFLAATYPLYPSVARLWAIGDTGTIQRLLTQTGRVVFLSSCVIAVLLLVLAHQALELFGSEFTDGAAALRILVLGQLLAIAAGFGGLALVMTPHAKSMTLSVGLGVAANVVLAAAMIPVWGANGAALAAAAGAFVTGALGATFAWRRLGIYAPALGSPPARERSGA